MNIGQLLEVLIVSFVLLELLSLFTLQYFSLSTLLLNERESRRILSLLVLSDYYISNKIALERLNTKVNNLVDCERIAPEENLYIRCGRISYGNPEGKLVLKRIVVDINTSTIFEVGIT